MAILAEKLGAKEIFAFDIDEWSYENTLENIQLNDCQYITMKQGSIETLEINGNFDIIIANIQRNVLHEEMSFYSQYLKKGGDLLLSGFYESDKDFLIKRGQEFGLKEKEYKTQDNWCVLRLEKI